MKTTICLLSLSCWLHPWLRPNLSIPRCGRPRARKLRWWCSKTCSVPTAAALLLWWRRLAALTRFQWSGTIFRCPCTTGRSTRPSWPATLIPSRSSWAMISVTTSSSTSLDHAADVTRLRGEIRHRTQGGLALRVDPQGKLAAAINEDKNAGQRCRHQSHASDLCGQQQDPGQAFVEVVDRTQLFQLIDAMKNE